MMISKEMLRNDINIYLETTSFHSANYNIIKKMVANNFINILPERFEIISEDNILKWYKLLKVKNNTKISYFRVLINILKFLRALDYNIIIPKTPKYHDDYRPYIFTKEQIEIIESKFDNMAETRSRIHYACPIIFRLLYSTGMRINEVVTLRGIDLNFDQGSIKLLKTKGEKERYVVLSASMNQLLKAYFVKMNIFSNLDNYIFIQRNGRHVSADQFRKEFKKATEFIKEENSYNLKIIPHCLRHYFVITSFNINVRNEIASNMTMQYLSTYLGHRSLKETEKYLKFSDKMVHEEIKKFEDFAENIFLEVEDNED